MLSCLKLTRAAAPPMPLPPPCQAHAGSLLQPTSSEANDRHEMPSSAYTKFFIRRWESSIFSQLRWLSCPADTTPSTTRAQGSSPTLPTALATSSPVPHRHSPSVKLRRRGAPITGSGYDVIQEEQVKSLWGSPFMKLNKTNFHLFLSKGKHWCISPPLGILLYNCL